MRRGAPTAAPTATTTKAAEAPAAPPSLTPAERQQLAAAVRTAPVIPSALLKEPAVAALADEARRVLARGSGRRPEDVEVDARVLPGSGDRVVVFRDASGRKAELALGAPLSSPEAHGIARGLADLNVIAGVGAGFRIVPGVLSTGAMPTVARFRDRDDLARHLRVGASTTLGGGAWVWELADKPRSVGPAVAMSLPFVSVERDPLLGDKLELSIPGYVTVLAAVKKGEQSGTTASNEPGRDDIGWLGVVWHQGLLGPGPGPTVHAKLVVGHPALAAPLGPIVGAASRAMSPLMTRLHALGRGADHATPSPSTPEASLAPAR
jgi:hypothetical protein